MCYRTKKKKKHESAYALFACLCYHCDNALSFAIGLGCYFIKAQKSCSEIPPPHPPPTKALVQLQSNTCPHKPHTGPRNCGGKQFKRWGCILGTFVPQPEHSTFQHRAARASVTAALLLVQDGPMTATQT